MLIKDEGIQDGAQFIPIKAVRVTYSEKPLHASWVSMNQIFTALFYLHENLYSMMVVTCCYLDRLFGNITVSKEVAATLV